MKVIAILAADKNGVIGDGPRLPWKLADDMASFKNRTEHNIVIMGRKTFESIGKRLPNRVNIVVSKSGFEAGDGVVVAESLDSALNKAIALAEIDHQHIYIIGGAQLYNTAFEQGIVDEIIYTDVNTALMNLVDPVRVDMKFLYDFSIQETERYQKDVRNDYAFTINRGIRKKA